MLRLLWCLQATSEVEWQGGWISVFCHEKPFGNSMPLVGTIYAWNPNDLYFWRSNPQNKAFSNQNKGHLGSRWIYFNEGKHFSSFSGYSSGVGTQGIPYVWRMVNYTEVQILLKEMGEIRIWKFTTTSCLFGNWMIIWVRNSYILMRATEGSNWLLLATFDKLRVFVHHELLSRCNKNHPSWTNPKKSHLKSTLENC